MHKQWAEGSLGQELHEQYVEGSLDKDMHVEVEGTLGQEMHVGGGGKGIQPTNNLMGCSMLTMAMASRS